MFPTFKKAPEIKKKIAIPLILIDLRLIYGSFLITWWLFKITFIIFHAIVYSQQICLFFLPYLIYYMYMTAIVPWQVFDTLSSLFAHGLVINNLFTIPISIISLSCRKSFNLFLPSLWHYIHHTIYFVSCTKKKIDK